MAKEAIFIKRKYNDAISFLEKKYGKDVLISEDADKDIKRVETGLYHFDKSIGGGIPLGRIIELFGSEESGKTTLSSMIASIFQKAFPDKIVLYLDFEHTLDLEYIEKLGVSLSKEKWRLAQPVSLEEGIDILGVLAYTGRVSLVIVDSVAAMTPLEELEGSMSNNTMGAQARGLGKTFRKLTGILKKTDTTSIFINQIRDRIGGYGSPFVTPGGKALKFYSSVRMRVASRRSGWFGEIGKRSTFNIVKNKTSMQQNQKSEYELVPGEGFLKTFELFEIGREMGFIKEDGRGYKMMSKKCSLDELLERLKNKKIRDFIIRSYEKKNEA